MWGRPCANGCAPTTPRRSGQANHLQRPQLADRPRRPHLARYHQPNRAVCLGKWLAVAGGRHQHRPIAQLGIKFAQAEGDAVTIGGLRHDQRRQRRPAQRLARWPAAAARSANHAPVHTWLCPCAVNVALAAGSRARLAASIGRLAGNAAAAASEARMATIMRAGAFGCDWNDTIAPPVSSATLTGGGFAIGDGG